VGWQLGDKSLGKLLFRFDADTPGKTNLKNNFFLETLWIGF
jgi:hypothetical protein